MARLSLCMIVRDEGAILARAISSFAGVADEIIVVDTGSTDHTIAVAEEAGAKVVRHEWRDSFAEARNAGFDACTGDWIFAMDADERLLPESREEVRRLVDRGEAQGYMVTRRDLTPGGASEMRFMRLGRRVAQRLVGRIHEHFEPSWSDVRPSGILIEHDGYLGEKNDARRIRNVRLLEMELQDRPGQPYYLADLAHTYWLLKDLRWKETLGRVYATLDPSGQREPVSLMPVLLEIVFVLPESELPPGVNLGMSVALVERWYPTSIPLLVARARRAFGRNDLAEAADLGERAIRAWDDGTYGRSISFNPSIVGAELRLNVGVALANSGRLDESLIRFEEAAKDPHFAELANRNALAIRTARI